VTNQPTLLPNHRVASPSVQLSKIPRESETLAWKCLFNQLKHDQFPSAGFHLDRKLTITSKCHDSQTVGSLE
jgi:hypothetical protein